MLTHGWNTKPSPRRGFTVIEASRAKSPVVLAVHDSLQALGLFRCALEEAMSRVRNLMVLDYGTTSLHDELQDDAVDLDEHDRSTMRALWTSPHVEVVRMDPTESRLGSAIAYCEAHEASLLIVGAANFVSTELDPALAERVFSGKFDLLVLTEHAL